MTLQESRAREFRFVCANGIASPWRRVPPEDGIQKALHKFRDRHQNIRIDLQLRARESGGKEP